MPLTDRSIARQGGSVVAALVDGLLLLMTVMFMATALVTAFAADYWLLGLLISLLTIGVSVVLVLTVFAAGEGGSEWNDERFRRTAAYLLAPLIVSAVASVLAWAVVLVVIPGGIY